MIMKNHTKFKHSSNVNIKARNYRLYYGWVSLPPYCAVNLEVLQLEQLNEQCYGGRIRMKTVGLMHLEFPDLINSRHDIQK